METANFPCGKVHRDVESGAQFYVNFIDRGERFQLTGRHLPGPRGTSKKAVYEAIGEKGSLQWSNDDGDRLTPPPAALAKRIRFVPIDYSESGGRMTWNTLSSMPLLETS